MGRASSALVSKREGRKTLMKLVVCQQTQKILGAHMLGEDAAEIKKQGLEDAAYR